MTPLLLEVTSKHPAHLPSRLMAEAVASLISRFGNRVACRAVDLSTPAGRDRFLALSVALHGETAVLRHLRLAPVPALFMDGRLAFDIIPPEDELAAAVERRLKAVDFRL